MKDNYENPPIYITENGYSDRTGTLDDEARVHYYKMYLNEVLKGESTHGEDFPGITVNDVRLVCGVYRIYRVTTIRGC